MSVFQTITTAIRAHKIKSIIALIIIAGGIFWIAKAAGNANAETRYVLSETEKGTLISSVTGSGQVSTSNQVELTAKASGDITSVRVVAGQEVKSGELIASIDASDAALELENAKLAYEELVTVDPNDIRKAQNTVTEAKEGVEDAYQDGRTALSTQSIVMSDTLADIDALFSGYIGPNNSQGKSNAAKALIATAEKEYYEAEESLKDFQKAYRAAGSVSDEDAVETLLESGGKTAALISDSAKSAKDAVSYMRGQENSTNTTAETAYTSVSTAATDANSSVSSFSSTKSAIDKAERALEDADEALTDVNDGADELDIRSEQLSLKQKQQAYSDYFVRAPFDGVIASVDAKKGESANSGTTIATLITHDKIAEISLNEVDAAKVALGNKVTLTFDALEDLSISGTVAEVDAIGTVSSGVVNYTVKINFDTDDARVKSGMSVSASIVTEAKTDVLMVPTSAIKNNQSGSYVLVLENTDGATGSQGVTSAAAPTEVSVTVGSSNDTMTEILSGLTEGQQVVSRTIAASASTTSSSTSAPSLLGGSSTRTGGGTTRTTGATTMPR